MACVHLGRWAVAALRLLDTRLFGYAQGSGLLPSRLGSQVGAQSMFLCLMDSLWRAPVLFYVSPSSGHHLCQSLSYHEAASPQGLTHLQLRVSPPPPTIQVQGLAMGGTAIKCKLQLYPVGSSCVQGSLFGTDDLKTFKKSS